MPYGTWVIREIESPTGFVLSEEEITVTIGAVDEVVEIELVNYFIKGNIELTKVDKDYPDNKLTGAEFEVYTDTNGEIFIEGLRIGEYTVYEVSDSVSSGYILPADKQAAVKVGATTIVEMHNELRDTPKTGDDFNIALWVSLAAASVLGAGVLGFVGFKKKKKED